MTRAEQILQSFFDAIQAGNIGATNHRTRTESFGLSELPATNLKPGSDNASKIGTGVRRHNFEILVDVHVAGVQPDTIADGYISKVHEAVTAWQPLIDQIAEIEYNGREWDFDDGDEQRGKVVVKYMVVYSTTGNQL